MNPPPAPRRTLAKLLLALLVLPTLALAEHAPMSSASAPSAEQLHQALQADAAKGLLQVLSAAEARWEQVRSFRALFVKQERHAGDKQASPEETIDYKFLKDQCVLMVWASGDDEGKTVLFVRGKYANKMQIKVKKFFWFHVERNPDDPEVMAETNHPITDAGFGMALTNIRKRVEDAMAKGAFKATYVGREPGPDKRDCLVVRGQIAGNPKLTQSTVWFDAENLMPIKVVNQDALGFLERYEYRRLSLDPVLSGGRPELTVLDFRRSQVFDCGDWRRETETWTFADVCKDAERLSRLRGR